MAVLGVGSVGIAQVGTGGAAKPPSQKFSLALEQAKAPAARPRIEPRPVEKPSAEAVSQRPAARAIDQVSSAQTRMDKVLELAQSGKTFTPAELLALQTQMYRASQELDLAGKVVEKATGGVKQVLQTQV
ncbi:MAG: ATP-dependent helicase HrpB [Archangiaceae bacterium]|nr:ATP-dependent helicase HrpB [Archangiaceae bacterium]